MRMWPLALGVIAASTVSAVAAQAPTYRRTPGDTLRYVFTMNGNTTAEGAGVGGMEMGTKSEMKMVVAFFPNDTMRMWTEAATMTMTSPMGDMSPSTAAFLNKPGTYRMLPNGRTEVITKPDLGPELNQFANAMPQQATMFMTLPRDLLRVGLTWSDTVNLKSGSPDGNQTSTNTINRYRVVRDTVVDGERVFAIEFQGTSAMEMVMVMAAQNLRTQTNQTGSESGFIHFSPERGALVRKVSTVTAEGGSQMSGAMDRSMTTRSRFEMSLVLVR